MVRYPFQPSILVIATLCACTDSGGPALDTTPGPPATLVVVSGDEQHGIAGQTLAAPVVIQVVDSNGLPVPDQPLAFTADLGGGTVSIDTGYTNRSGTIQVQWTLGPDPTTPQRLLVEVIRDDLGPALYTWFTAFAHAAPTGLHFTTVATGALHSCGLTPEGKAYCWGTTIVGSEQLAPTPIAQDLTFTSITAGYAHTCALTPTGAAYCWGQNAEGQLGDGTRSLSLTPRAVSGELVFKQIAAGVVHTCALKVDGQAYCWGDNDFGPPGKLGDGTTTDRLRPTPVLGRHTFQMLTLGGSFTCGLSEGHTYCWGQRIGTGTGASDLSPVRLNGSPTFTFITAGANYACGLTADGSANCWGTNSIGELGTGTLDDSPTPVPVSGELTFSALDAGDFHACGVTAAGSLACWGWDDQTVDSREFNGGTSIHSTTPQVVPGAPAFVQLSNGAVHGCGVTAEQLAYCWFDNSSGQLGTGDRTSSYQPVLVQ